ncbi:FAD dependent oxidoreductase [Mollisia scopiformis]|uniref:FAD dependent oxidoreductase n=1 Tax=Mollisia scopiformis TaxID=149040 RepID=A0A194X6W6_MOLSC|nr:FAD dependent oxidoreductase [Mollisia scopiformis]KUJ15915.1 FAD dependent oxidoreductase [Mollisia scopiformis]
MTGATTKPGQSSLPTPNSTKAFWHSQPSKILLGHRTTPTIPAEADIVIIGSGISGASAAHFLSQNEESKKLSVVMLEAREACWGATGRNGGHCQPGIYDRSPELSSFEMRNYLALKDLITKNNIACDWRDLSVVHGYMQKSIFEEALAEYQSHQRADPEIAKLVTVVTKDSSNPSLQDLRVSNAYGAIVQKHASSVWPYKLVCWMLENLLSLNNPVKPAFNLQTKTPATHLQKAEDGSWIVHTPRGMISAKQVLLATNAYTSYLLPSFSDIIVPVRGEMSSLVPPKAMWPGNENAPLEYSYGFMGNGDQNGHRDDYLVQRPYSPSGGNGELMFGGGRSYAKNAGLGVSDDSDIDPPAAEYLKREISLVLDLRNEGKPLEATYEWSGIMGFSRDDRPWVGEVSEELGLGGDKGLWICAAYTGHGMPNAFLSAKAVVELMMGRKDDQVDLPSVHRISKERVEKAKMLEDVQVADWKGIPL